MPLNESKLQQYHQLKKLKSVLDQRVDRLNKELKEDLTPGEHVVGSYRAVFTLKKQYTISEYQAWKFLPTTVLTSCTKETLDPDLVESAYLRGEIPDWIMKRIRGQAKIIPHLIVDKIEHIEDSDD